MTECVDVYDTQCVDGAWVDEWVPGYYEDVWVPGEEFWVEGYFADTSHYENWPLPERAQAVLQAGAQAILAWGDAVPQTCQAGLEEAVDGDEGRSVDDASRTLRAALGVCRGE